MKLSDRIFRCSKCGLILDRDINAAMNILNRGMKELLKNRHIFTPGTGGRACEETAKAVLSSLNREQQQQYAVTMIQEAPAFNNASSQLKNSFSAKAD